MHGVVTIHYRRLLQGNTASATCQQLPPDLGTDGMVAMALEQIQQGLALVFGDIVTVTLGKRQEALVPDDGELVLHRRALLANIHHDIALLHRGGVLAGETQEVENQSVEDLVRESVLLLESDWQGTVSGP